MHVHETRAEHRVINEHLIREGIQIQDVSSTSVEERRQSIPFEDVLSLRLSFRNIVSIVHLGGLRALTKLQLDNNHISRIVNLDALVNLEWLDLSFNQIEKIEGLERLTKLTDLSLFNNKIKRIENMDVLKRLQIFSVGNNQITQLDDIDYLRRFKQLSILKLSGNPICEVEGYRSYVLSRLDALESLNYKRIQKSELTEAKEHHQDELIEILERDEKQAAQEMSLEQREENDELMSKANLSGINDLFEKMERDDLEWKKLKHIPGLTELWNETKTKFSNHSQDFKVAVLTHMDEREAETRLWDRSSCSYVRTKQEIRKGLIFEFDKEKKRLMRRRDIDRMEIVSCLKTKLMHLKQSLLETEEEVVTVQRQFNREYEASLSELSAKGTALYATYFTQIRDLLNGFATGLNSVALGALEKFHIDSDFDKVPEEARALLSDKDVLIASLQNSHDFKVYQIDTIEEQLAQKQMFTLQRTSSEMLLDEKKRTKERVTEILNYIGLNITDVEEFSAGSNST